jgi:hypothetical protein
MLEPARIRVSGVTVVPGADGRYPDLPPKPIDWVKFRKQMGKRKDKLGASRKLSVTPARHRPPPKQPRKAD